MFFKKKRGALSGLFSKKKESIFSDVFSKNKTSIWSDVSNSVSDIAKQTATSYKKANISERVKEASNIASDLIKESATASKKHNPTEYIKDAIRAGTTKSTSWGNKVKSADIIGKSTTAINQILSSGVAKDVDRWLRDSFTQGTSTVYDKAMDSARQLSGEFGGNHRLFDGAHSLTGAWEKVTNALPNDSILDEAKGYVSALAKDGFTPSGLPVMTFDRSNFTQLVENTGISREWIEDAASVTGTELIGSSVAGVAAFLKWDKNDVSEFTKLASSMGIYSIASANPLLTITSISSLAHSWHISEKDNSSKAMDMVKGAMPAATFVTVAGVVPGPALFGLIAGAATAHVAKQAVDKHFDGGEVVSNSVALFSSFKEASEYAKSNQLSVLHRDGNGGWQVKLKA